MNLVGAKDGLMLFFEKDECDRQINKPSEQDNPGYNKRWILTVRKASETVGGCIVVRTKNHPFYILSVLFTEDMRRLRFDSYYETTLKMLLKVAEDLNSDIVSIQSSKRSFHILEWLGFKYFAHCARSFDYQWDDDLAKLAIHPTADMFRRV